MDNKNHLAFSVTNSTIRGLRCAWRCGRREPVQGSVMSNKQDQIWQGKTFTIERRQDPAAHAVVFRFSGPFTARDMYSSLSPTALHNIFEVEPPRPTPSVNIFDLTEVPYMDSCGLG